MIPAKYRGAVYVIAVASLVLVTVVGMVAPEELNQAAEAAAKIVGALASLLALLNITPDQ